MLPVSPLRALGDDDLLARLEMLVAQERESAADVVEHLMEVDRRELAVDRAYPSLFVYCVKKLDYSEGAAFLRIRAARAAARFPDILKRLRSGALHLDAVARLSPYLDQDNGRQLLDMAAGASKREVLSLVANLQTEPGARRDVIAAVRASAPSITPLRQPGIPAATGRASAGSASNPIELVPTPLHRFHFTADAELLAMVERLRGLLRHKIPDGRLESIFKEAAKTLLSHLERRHQPMKPPVSPQLADNRQGSRYVPRTVKRAVWTRDGGRCAYQAADGRRCESRDALEYDHIVPWADGGRSDTPDNIRLLCRAHNQRLGRRRFGPRRRGEKATRPS